MASLSTKDSKLLWGRSRNLCAFPQCRTLLTASQSDAATGQAFDVVIGEEAHIHSATASGPRYDPTYPEDKLETYENRILLCPADHTRIDADKGRGFTAESLREMKAHHERQEQARERIASAVRAYVADQYVADDKVLFRQVRLEGPRVDTMFVDVPFAARDGSEAARRLAGIAATAPGDAEPGEGFVVTGAAQALLHPAWAGNALLVGGPGQGKSTLLQYVCQFHRARYQDVAADYTGEAQGLTAVTSVIRVPIRLDLRDYAQWASRPRTPGSRRQQGGGGRRRSDAEWPTLEEYLAEQIGKRSGTGNFKVKDLTTLIATEPILLALDGLDEVADLKHRDQVADEIVRSGARLDANAHNLVILVATRPGLTSSPLWSSPAFPIHYLQKLTAGLRLQYLQRWTRVTEMPPDAADKFQETFLEHENLPHIRDLASYPMQLAILLHLLHRRGLLPEQRTELYKEYVQTFLDREETEGKEPLLSSERKTIEDIHGFLGWHLQQQAEAADGAGEIARDELRRQLGIHLSGRDKGRELAETLFAAMESRVLCLIERRPGFFRFEVQSLREYFAAAHIYQNMDPRGREGNSTQDAFTALLERPYWLNTCRFLVGLFTSFEIGAIEGVLRDLQADRRLALHPHLRLAAGRLIDDRAYQGQSSRTLGKVVDFILDGPGVVLAQDGFLDESGQSLSFAEDAGRAQAVDHLRRRLATTSNPGQRQAAAEMLRRHEAGADATAWWWTQFEPTGEWLTTLADLGSVSTAGGDQEARLAQAVAASATDEIWAVELLALGGYPGNADVVLAGCRDDLADGAFDLIEADASTPLGKIANAARAAVGRPQVSARVEGPRRRVRTSAGHRVAAELLTATEALPARPIQPAASSSWASRVAATHRLWGRSWLTLQVVCSLPAGCDLGAIARAVGDGGDDLAATLRLEEQARTHRTQTDWWQSQWRELDDDLDRRAWLFRILTGAPLSVVVASAAEIDEACAGPTPRHYRAMELSLIAAGMTGRAAPRPLQEPLRLGRATYSGRALWLLHLVADDASRAQMQKKLWKDYVGPLFIGMSDRRPVVALLGNLKTLRVSTLKGTRPMLPSSGWSETIALGNIASGLQARILEHPEDWPLAVVGKAIQQESAMTTQIDPIARVATDRRWFETAD